MDAQVRVMPQNCHEKMKMFFPWDLWWSNFLDKPKLFQKKHGMRQQRSAESHGLFKKKNNILRNPPNHSKLVVSPIIIP